jgi:hypothetical protein
MLGRQQIAGIPTAVHELFKNAHDAYAEDVRVDFYRADQLLILRDNGLGMTRDDFESRWLTLGTESKVGANDPSSTKAWTGPKNAPFRPITGEKGIGRLAIAAIGPQVLVMTRAIRPDGLKPLVVSLIHWGLFEIPGIDLDSIDIPIEEVADGALPDLALVTRLVDKVRKNVLSFEDKISLARKEKLLKELDLAAIDPSLLSKIPGPSLAGDGYGTHFIIRPSSSVLADDIDSSESDDDATPLEKVLLGFSNTMLPDSPKPAITAEFWDHREDGTDREVIGDSVFFTPDEFSSADHEIIGEFDEYGQFVGTVSVYHQEPRKYTVSWPGSTGRLTECGRFKLRFAYVQGLLRDSRLPPKQWAELSGKLNKIGGLYIYRDGIRILPYGNSDFDFLGIERRRTKSAQDWFFSYRRILGAVEISYENNSELVEKAGREGFRTNRAYREFVDMLENVFKRLAYDFFRPSSQFGEDYATTKLEIKKEALLLKKREKSTKGKRGELKTNMESFFRNVEKGVAAEEAARIFSDVSGKVKSVLSINDPHRSTEALLDVERDFRSELEKLERGITVVRPRGIGMTKSLEADWMAYVRNADRVRQEVILPLAKDVDQLIAGAGLQGAEVVDRRRRLLAILKDQQGKVQAESLRLRREVLESSKSLSDEVDRLTRSSLTRLQQQIEDIYAEVGRTDTAAFDDDRLLEMQRRWEKRAEVALFDTSELMESLRDQLVSLTSAVTGRETLDAVTGALESRIEALQDQVESYVELAQSGMALGIVQHEFGSTVKQIRAAIRRLKPWADSTPDLVSIYNLIKHGFDHLDTYLSLFTPLSRRLNRAAIELSGEEIRHYLVEVFGVRLERKNIRLVGTPNFDASSIKCYPSTILPGFVNLVDNAIHWIDSDPESKRDILLDSDGSGFLISNGGPGIPLRMADQIFEFGISMKSGGRGMGLYLSRQALRREGMDLVLEVAGENRRPVFRILFEGDSMQAGISV